MLVYYSGFVHPLQRREGGAARPKLGSKRAGLNAFFLARTVQRANKPQSKP